MSSWALIINAVLVAGVVLAIVGMLGYSILLDHASRRGSEDRPSSRREAPPPQRLCDPETFDPKHLRATAREEWALAAYGARVRRTVTAKPPQAAKAQPLVGNGPEEPF